MEVDESNAANKQARGAAHEPASAAFLRHIEQLEKGECWCCWCWCC